MQMIRLTLADLRHPNFVNCIQFLGKFGKIMCWRPLEGWPPLLGEILDPPLAIHFKRNSWLYNWPDKYVLGPHRSYSIRHADWVPDKALNCFYCHFNFNINVCTIIWISINLARLLLLKTVKSDVWLFRIW